MKILVLNGNPKKETSDTMHLTHAFLRGMQEAAPQEIQSIDVIDRRLGFCRGCFACKYNDGQCVQDDDMREILEQMLESDLLLFSFPLYCYSMPAALKNLFERMLPLSSMAMAEVNGRYPESLARTLHQDMTYYSYGLAILANTGHLHLTDEALLASFRREFTALAGCYGVSPVPLQYRNQEEERRDIQ